MHVFGFNRRSRAARIAAVHSGRAPTRQYRVGDYKINEFYPALSNGRGERDGERVFGSERERDGASNFALLRPLLSKEITFRQVPYKDER